MPHDERFVMSDSDARVAPCPTCGAAAGKMCISRRGNEIHFSHAARWSASRAVIAADRRQKQATT